MVSILFYCLFLGITHKLCQLDFHLWWLRLAPKIVYFYSKRLFVSLCIFLSKNLDVSFRAELEWDLTLGASFFTLSVVSGGLLYDLRLVDLLDALVLTHSLLVREFGFGNHT